MQMLLTAHALCSHQADTMSNAGMQSACFPDTLVLAHWAQALGGHGVEDGGEA